MLGPKAFRRFILPHLKRFVDLGHRFGKHVILHCDGSIRALLPDLIAIGLDGMQSVQPLCHGMELARAEARFRRAVPPSWAASTRKRSSRARKSRRGS